MCPCCGPRTMDSNPRVLPTISPAASPKSSASSVLNCSDISADADAYRRSGMEDCSTDSIQEDSGNGSKVHHPSFVLRPQENGANPSNTVPSNKIAGGNAASYDIINGDRNHIGIADGPERESSNVVDSSLLDEECETSTNEEVDARFWLPPEPKDADDVIASDVWFISPGVESDVSTTSSSMNDITVPHKFHASENLLVLMSIWNASRGGSMCEARRFSRIKFYRNFDVPLEKFLRDYLLQRPRCKACSDPPETHIFYYAHHNKHLTIKVRRLPIDESLPGETKGELWMWSRCGKCKFHNGSSKSTKRVLISNAARGLSFGKFLELGFSHNSSFGPSYCAHTYKDFLHFFGFGCMVAMFKYSTVAAYSAPLPPQRLDFKSTLTGNALAEEFKDVHSIGIEIFKDIEKSLKKMAPKFGSVILRIQGTSKELSDIEQMLNQERSQFEGELRNAQNENQDKAAYKCLSLNRMRLVLLIESYVWDQRLHALSSCDVSKTKDIDLDQREGQTHSEGDSKLENDKGLFWSPFSENLQHFMQDIHETLRSDTSPGFSSVFSFPLESTAHRMITDEGSKLHFPLGSGCYILSDYENEFSSIIACALAKDQLLAAEDNNKENSTSSLDSNSHAPSSVHSEDSRLSCFGGWLDHSLVSDGDVYPEISLENLSGKAKYNVTILYANQFCELRKLWCPSEFDYLSSLSRCKSWDAKGGKSKSLFAKTLDDRFIIKDIKSAELDSFVNFAPHYFGYMNQCHKMQYSTCLAKILGIYKVESRQKRSGKVTERTLMVMENLSFGQNFTRIYDLKGALHARLITSGNGSGDVLLDQNFVNDTNSSPLCVSIQSKRLLQRGYWNDTNFLKSIGVMDYSLLVGVDSQRQELSCGIIDYLMQYTCCKKLETFVKSPLVPKNHLPTIIPPGDYSRRFRKFIDTHFVSIPDDWCPQTNSAHGKSPDENEHEDVGGAGNGTSA